jgi:hypothetical protein
MRDESPHVVVERCEFFFLGECGRGTEESGEFFGGVDAFGELVEGHAGSPRWEGMERAGMG